jgi:hypothetical protein
LTRKTIGYKKTEEKRSGTDFDDYLVDIQPEQEGRFIFKKNDSTMMSLKYIKTIGAGGMASIFLVEDEQSQSLRVLRKLSHLGQEYGIVLESTQMIQQISHPGIAQIEKIFLYKSMMKEHTLYMIMVPSDVFKKTNAY